MLDALVINQETVRNISYKNDLIINDIKNILTKTSLLDIIFIQILNNFKE